MVAVAAAGEEKKPTKDRKEVEDAETDAARWAVGRRVHDRQAAGKAVYDDVEEAADDSAQPEYKEPQKPVGSTDHRDRG
jgi:hypothetical protein